MILCVRIARGEGQYVSGEPDRDGRDARSRGEIAARSQRFVSGGRSGPWLKSPVVGETRALELVHRAADKAQSNKAETVEPEGLAATSTASCATRATNGPRGVAV